MKRLIVAAVAVAGALLLQLTIVNRLPWPGGGAPDLVLLCVVAIGLVAGPQPGIVAGFCAGLALDVAPPAHELIGQYALVFCLVGYCCGRLTSALRHSAVFALAAAAGAVVAGEVLSACLVLVLDTPEATLATVAHVLPSSAAYDLAVSPLVMFAAVRIAVALGMSFDPGEDSPALETGGSARPMGLARLARLRQLRNSSLGAGSPGMAWLTGDSATEMAPVGSVGWLSGPATSRRARREQARLTAALTGAAPRKGAFWVGSRPPGLRPGSSTAATPSSGLSKLRPDTGVAGSATRASLPVPGRPSRTGLFGFTRRGGRRAGGQVGGSALIGTDWHGLDRHGVNGPGLPSISFSGSKTAGAPSGRPDGGVPKIAFGGGGLPGGVRAPGRKAPRIAFKTGGMAGVPDGGRPGTSAGTPKIAFGTGGLAGAGRAAGRGAPKIGFGSGGLPSGPRMSPGRSALPRFRSGSSSATGQWLAGSRLRDAGFSYVSSAGPARRRRSGRGALGSRPARTRRLKTARLRRRGITRWLPWLRRSGGRPARWRISRRPGGER